MSLIKMPNCFNIIERNDMSYENLLKTLHKINSKYPARLDLDNIRTIYNSIGRPLRNIPVIHIGGTNGKGSVCWKTAQCLKSAGFKTGLFTSPHIASFRERILVDGVPLSELDFVNNLKDLFSVCSKHNIPATYFELTTALAFMKFAQEKCDVAVIEVGLGGRLDATNVIDEPVLSVITSVQLDHVNILGDTIEKIAIEKSGIMKSNVPVLIGQNVPYPILQSQAKRTNSLFYSLSDVLSNSELRPVSVDEFIGNRSKINANSKFLPNIHPEYININITRAILKIIQNKSFSPFSRYTDMFSRNTMELNTHDLMSRPPCRFEVMQFKLQSSKDSVSTEVEVILDIAHNQAAMANLANTIEIVYGKQGRDIRVVFGMSAEKDMSGCIDILVGLVKDSSRIYCTKASNPRAVNLETLQKLIDDSSKKVGKLKHRDPISGIINEDLTLNSVSSSIRQAMQDIIVDLQRCKSTETSIKPLVVICGTTFIMAEARAELGINEPRDRDFLDDLKDMQESFSNT